jgi:ferredoxin
MANIDSREPPFGAWMNFLVALGHIISVGRNIYMKATVDQDLCLGCGVCAVACPEVFEMDNNDKAQVKVCPIPSEAEAGCRDASDQCPVSAIIIEDD